MADLSNVQMGVQLVQNMIQCGMNGAEYERRLQDLHAHMSDFAMTEFRSVGLIDRTVPVEVVTDEQNETTRMAEEYWRQTSVFFRKVFQACAAGA